MKGGGDGKKIPWNEDRKDEKGGLRKGNEGEEEGETRNGEEEGKRDRKTKNGRNQAWKDNRSKSEECEKEEGHWDWGWGCCSNHRIDRERVYHPCNEQWLVEHYSYHKVKSEDGVGITN